MTKKEKSELSDKKILGVSETPSISKPECSSSEPRAFLFDKSPQAVYGRQLEGLRTKAGLELPSRSSLFYLRLGSLPQVPEHILGEAELSALAECSAFTLLGSSAMAMAVELGLLDDETFWSHLGAGQELVGVSLPDLTFVFKDPDGILTYYLTQERSQS